jgi:hypothetical protein
MLCANNCSDRSDGGIYRAGGGCHVARLRAASVTEFNPAHTGYNSGGMLPALQLSYSLVDVWIY